MTDPSPLTREELKRFLPNQRAIRAFENLFALVPGDLVTVSDLAQSALSLAQNAVAENTHLRKQVKDLEIELVALRRQQDVDALRRRINNLETLVG